MVSRSETDRFAAMQWDEEFEVVCVSSGLGGLSAAVTAAHAGAKVLVLEKFSLLGGVSARTAAAALHVRSALHMTDKSATKEDTR